MSAHAHEVSARNGTPVVVHTLYMSGGPLLRGCSCTAQDPGPPRSIRFATLAISLTAGSALMTASPAVAVTGPAAADSDTTHAYTAQLVIGDHDRGCSGVLVDTEWLLTAASCFADNPAESLAVPPGKPPWPPPRPSAGPTSPVRGRRPQGRGAGAAHRP